MAVILLYLSLNFIVNLLLATIYENNPVLYEGFTLVETLLFLTFIYTQLRSRTAKKLVLITNVLFTIFFFLYNFLVKSAVIIDSIPIGIETLLILPFSFYFLYEQTTDTSTLFIYHRYTFWIILGIVLYLAGCFFIYIFANFVGKGVLKYWGITNAFSILKNVLFCIAIFIHAKPSKEKLKYDFEFSSLN